MDLQFILSRAVFENPWLANAMTMILRTCYTSSIETVETSN